MKNKKNLMIAIVCIAVAVALLVGIIVWRVGGDQPDLPAPSDGTSQSTEQGSTGAEATIPSTGVPTETEPSNESTDTEPINLPSDPSIPVNPPDWYPPDPTDPPVTEPTEPAPDPTESATQPTEPAPTEPVVTWEEVNETVYAKDNVNVRKGPGAEYEKLGQLKKGDSVKRVAIGSNGWSRVEYNGQEAYISSGYLTTEEPQPETEPAVKEETLITMYVIQDTEYRTGPGTGYEVVESIVKGTAVAVVEDSETDNGYSKIYMGGEYYYIPTDHISLNRPGEETEPTKDPDDPWSRYVGPANPETGISWDGESPIIYTYEDGTTGTELREGENLYEEYPGSYAIVLITNKDPYDDPLYYDGVWHCGDCGRVNGDGTNGTCMYKMVGGEFICEFCGEVFQGFTCHTCDED